MALQPPTSERLQKFPQSMITTAKQLYRAHRVDLGPWYFCCDGSGRFDLDEPDGTCYLAEGPVAALRETLGGRLVTAGVVDGAEVDRRQISALHLPADIRVANTTASAAANHGVTRELGTVVPYDVPQAWAQAWAAAGVAGIRYLGRFSTATGNETRCVAVFGLAGVAATHYQPDPTPTPARAVATKAGIRVIDPMPPVAGLTVVDPPVSA